MTSRIVIIGGGQAGGWAAKTLRDEGFDGEICVVAEEEWDFYERPPLSKASLLEPDAALPRLFSDEVQQALNLTWYRPLRAESVDRDEKKVVLSNGEQLSYNILLIATGGRARLPSQAWASHPQVYTLRHWQDAQRLKGRLAESKKLAIVGGGWIGLEIAASARKSGVAVTLFEQQPALCMRSVSGEVSQRLEAIHREQGWRSVPAAVRWSWRTTAACRSSTATASVKPLMRSWLGSASISIWSWRAMRG